MYFLPSFLSDYFFLFIALTLFSGFLLLRWTLSFLIFHWIQKKDLIKNISQTEKEALLAGSPWIEKEFFTGQPDLKKIFDQPLPLLNPEEKSFLDQEVERLCELSQEWQLVKRKKLSPATEDFLKKEKFFGLMISKKYNGRGFSFFALSKVIEKLSSHNIPLSVITMVPNSLGPAKLLLKYGTEEQKKKYLSKLATGEEIPCFGLTEDQAGSDAGSIQSTATLFKQGDRLKLCVNWKKRWITLSSKATLIGLAVQLIDPDHLYSDKYNLGISCLLISSQEKGVIKPGHHDPMGIPIYNAPIEGEHVVVDAEEALIGGLRQAGKGWKMLMECLSSGRGVCLPSMVAGCGKKISWLTGTHALVRKQFGLSIGKFEGVQEALAEIAGLTHLTSVTQLFTLSGLNQGIQSPTVAALTKYNLTELGQSIAKKGMDVMGGAGLSLGPKNKIALIQNSMPLAITVEGANILTRTFITYAQGLIKTHPLAYQILMSLEKKELKLFHRACWPFLYSLICNMTRGILFSLTRAGIILPHRVFSKRGRYIQKLVWSSSLFSFMGDLSFLILGQQLKKKGRLTGRLADILSYQYMASALLWHENLTKKSKSLQTETKWALDYCFFKIQKSLEAILNNYPVFWIRLAFKPLCLILKINPIGHPPSDSLGKQLAENLMEKETFRKALCSNIYFPKNSEDQFQKLNRAYNLSLKEESILKKVKKKAGKKLSIQSAHKKGFISTEEYETLKTAKAAQKEAIQVDVFPEEEYFA